MKQKEINALRTAFSIPEPQNKREFINKYKAMEEITERPKRLPIILSFATMVIGAAVLICVCINLKMTGDIRNQFNNSSVIIEDTTKSADKIETTSSFRTETTHSAVTSHTTTSVKSEEHTTENTSVTEKTQIQTETADNHITLNPTTAKTVQTTGIQTTNAEIKTTTSEQHENSDATTTQIKVTVTTTQKPITEIGKDYTLTPTRTYANDSNAYPWYDGKDQNAGGGANGGGPVPDGGDDKNGIGNGAKPPTQSMTLKEMLIHSTDTAVRAVPYEKIYTEKDGVPYIQYNVKITDSPFGNRYFRNGDRISVFIKGGYMSVKDFEEFSGCITGLPENSNIYIENSEMDELELNNEYLFFITDEGNDFYTAYNDSLVYVFTEENGKYVSVKSRYMVLE